MTHLSLHEFHTSLGAIFNSAGTTELVDNYGDPEAEHKALETSAGVCDLSFRSRLAVTGADRARFLHGQVTNDVNRLSPGQGCQAALVNNKGRMQSDLNVLCLTDELVLDFEPGLAALVRDRLEKFIIADDVQLVDVAPHYGLLSIQGPSAGAIVSQLGSEFFPPASRLSSNRITDPTMGDLYLVNDPRVGLPGFDLFVPVAALAAVFDKLIAAARSVGGRAVGWQALETARIEAGIPRFGADMDESTLPPEAGLDERFISYTKGCYIGQEVISRIRSVGQVARALRGLRLLDPAGPVPVRGDVLLHEGKPVGQITSAVRSTRLGGKIALGYVRREVNAVGTNLLVRTGGMEISARIVDLPFN